MFLVVVRNRKRVDLDATGHSADADAMGAVAAVQPGYISFKSYTAGDGEVIALSEWESEEAALGSRVGSDDQTLALSEWAGNVPCESTSRKGSHVAI
jgi:hypothetical protein